VRSRSRAGRSAGRTTWYRVPSPRKEWKSTNKWNPHKEENSCRGLAEEKRKGDRSRRKNLPRLERGGGKASSQTFEKEGKKQELLSRGEKKKTKK